MDINQSLFSEELSKKVDLLEQENKNLKGQVSSLEAELI